MACCGEEVDTFEVFPYLVSQITPDGSSNRDVHCPSSDGFGLGFDVCPGAASVTLKAPVPVNEGQGLKAVSSPGPNL